MKYNSIILSGLPGAGKSTLIKFLEEELHWKVFGAGDLWRARWKIWKKESLEHQLDFPEYWKNTSKEDNIKMNEEIRTLAERGNIILDSRYSAHYCKDLPSLRIFLYAGIATRAQRSSESKNFKIARAELVRRETDELSMAKQLYGDSYDYRTPTEYHLCLNSQELTPEQELKAILSCLK